SSSTTHPRAAGSGRPLASVGGAHASACQFGRRNRLSFNLRSNCSRSRIDAIIPDAGVIVEAAYDEGVARPRLSIEYGRASRRSAPAYLSSAEAVNPSAGALSCTTSEPGTESIIVATSNISATADLNVDSRPAGHGAGSGSP